MFSPNVLLAIYSVCGVIVAAAVLRIWMRDRANRNPVDRPDAKQQPSQPAVDIADVQEAATYDTLALSSGNGNGHRADEPHRDTPPVRPVSWEGRKLFSPQDPRLKRRESRLPQIDPEDVYKGDNSRYVFGAATPALAELLPESEDKQREMKQELVRAGYRNPQASRNLAAIRVVCMLAPMALFGLLLLVVPAGAEVPVLLSLAVGTALGWALPAVYVRNKSKDRVTQIERALPDMLDMLNMCVSQGLTVKESLRRIARDLQPVFPALAEELHVVVRQAEVGTMDQALQNFADRIDSPEVHSFTSLLIQTERMGTSVSTALIDYSDNFRETQRQRADEKANNAAFKLLFPTVLCLMPAVYMILLGPAIIEMHSFLRGGGRNVLDQGRQAIERVNADRPQ